MGERAERRELKQASGFERRQLNARQKLYRLYGQEKAEEMIREFLRQENAR